MNKNNSRFDEHYCWYNQKNLKKWSCICMDRDGKRDHVPCNILVYSAMCESVLQRRNSNNCGRSRCDKSASDSQNWADADVRWRSYASSLVGEHGRALHPIPSCLVEEAKRPPLGLLADAGIRASILVHGLFGCYVVPVSDECKTFRPTSSAAYPRRRRLPIRITNASCFALIHPGR